MFKAEVIDHFKKPSNVARALGISPAAVSKWGPIVPKYSAEEIERITGRALRVRQELYVRGRPIAQSVPNHAA
jgi:DNA-binding transcriptional regulator YdaS (Cro superfamily)